MRIRRSLSTLTAVALAATAVALTPQFAVAADADVTANPVTGKTVYINEVESKDGTPDDWVELYNPTEATVDLGGYIIKDDDDDHTFTIPANTTIGAGKYLVFDAVTDGEGDFDFGLGGNDEVRLFAADGTTLIDQVTWTEHADVTYGRDAQGTMRETAVPTKGGLNNFTGLVINEVLYNDKNDAPDAVELYNAGENPVDLTGYTLHDDKNRTDKDAAPLSGTLEPGKFLVLTKDNDFPFGYGKGDEVRIKDAAGTVVNSFAYEDTTDLGDWARCPDGTGAWAPAAAVTLGATNECEPATPEPPAQPTAPALVLNEIDSSPADWIEFTNPGDTALSLTGYEVRDNSDDHRWRFADDTTIDPGEYLVVNADTQGLAYNDETKQFATGTFAEAISIGSGDSIRVYDPSGTLIQNYSWTQHPAIDGSETAASWGRCPDTTGPFQLANATPGEANTCPIPAVAINEVESSGDTTDWVEIVNTGTTPVDISGWTLMDNDPAKHADETTPLPAGTLLEPGDFFVFDQGTNFEFGLGDPDTATVRDAAGNTVAEYSWTQHANGVYARCPDGTGDFIDISTSTKGKPNACGNPVVLNEVESKDAADGDDWIELYNPLDTTLDVSGLKVMDDKERDYVIPVGTSIDPHGYLVLTEAQFGFGLGSADEVRIFDGDLLIEQTSWTDHAKVTWGRCPDGTGEFSTTREATPGAINKCPGLPDVIDWPGSVDVTVQDTSPMFLSDSSGLDFADGILWAADNGTGTIWKLQANKDGSVAFADGWEQGKRVRYIKDADNSQAPGPDTEGITIAGDGRIYVATERDNSAKGVNDDRILVVDPNEAGPDLVAKTEWNLTDILPQVDANLGIEAVQWVANEDVAGKIPDLSQAEDGSVAYDPAKHPNAVADGVFFVGLEDNGHVYAFSLGADGTPTLLADLDPKLGGVMGLDYDESTGTLWAEADNGYNGRLAQLTLNGTATPDIVQVSRPANLPDVNNEGFAVATTDYCVDGSRPVWWFQDGVASASLRSGALDCATTTPDETQPDETTPGETTPGETNPDETTPDETTPGETTPEETQPGETTPGETTPEETQPGETTPGETTPGETEPGETTPDETTPGETTPGETQPGETQPGETQPGETQPGETQPGETQPIATKQPTMTTKAPAQPVPPQESTTDKQSNTDKSGNTDKQGTADKQGNLADTGAEGLLMMGIIGGGIIVLGIGLLVTRYILMRRRNAASAAGEGDSGATGES